MSDSSVVSSSAVPSFRNGAARSSLGDDSGRAVAAEFDALLLETVLAPVAKAAGFYGDVVAREAARSIASRLANVAS